MCGAASRVFTRGHSFAEGVIYIQIRMQRSVKEGGECLREKREGGTKMLMRRTMQGKISPESKNRICCNQVKDQVLD